LESLYVNSIQKISFQQTKSLDGILVSINRHAPQAWSRETH
jgi:hypothetical protein